MIRENVLFLSVGLLGGFILGYLVQESVASRQAPRLGAGGPAAAAVTGPAPRGAMAPTAGGGAAMPEIEKLRQRVGQNPNDPEAVVALANANFDIQNWGRAIELYLQVEKLRPGNPDVLTDLGVCYRATGQPDQALAYFRQAQALAPAHWQSRFNEIVVLAFDQGNMTAAGEAIARLRQIQPHSPELDRLEQEIARRRSAS